MGKIFIGLDLGGTKIATGLVDDQGRMLSKYRHLTEASFGKEHVICNMVEAIYELFRQSGIGLSEISGIGMGIPGLVDSTNGIAKSSSNLGWEDVPIGDIVQSEFNLPVVIENDVRVHAYGEKLFGAGVGIRDLVLITLGTGIGAGIFINNQLVKGHTGYSGEIGHVIVEPNGVPCRCGGRGCLEAYAGGWGIIERLKEQLGSGRESMIYDMVEGDYDKLTPEMLSIAAEYGDSFAACFLEKVGFYIGLALSSIINVLNPQMIVIGGGVAKAGERLLAPIRATIAERALEIHGRLCSIVPAMLGEDAGVIGAAALMMYRMDGNDLALAKREEYRTGGGEEPTSGEREKQKPSPAVKRVIG